MKRFGISGQDGRAMGGATVWLVQQWNPGTRFALLDKPNPVRHGI